MYLRGEIRLVAPSRRRRRTDIRPSLCPETPCHSEIRLEHQCSGNVPKPRAGPVQKGPPLWERSSPFSFRRRRFLAGASLAYRSLRHTRRPKFGRDRPKSGRNRAKSRRDRRRWVFGQSSAEIGPRFDRLQNLVGRACPKVEQCSAEIRLSVALEFVRSGARAGQCWSSSAPRRSEAAQTWTNSAHAGRLFARIGRPQPQFGRHRPTCGRNCPKSGQVWSDVDRTSARIRPNSADFDRMWQDLGKHRPALAEVESPIAD